MNKLTRILKIVGIPVLFALMLRFVFGVKTMHDLYSVMTISFLVCLPMGVGALTIFFSRIENVKSLSYRLGAPLIPILAFFVITCALAIEGFACWIMVLPFFLIAASIGGLIAGYFKLKAHKKSERLYVSVILLLPLFTSPLELMIGAIPGKYKAYTYIDIHASADKIWSNVTRVKEIEQQQDKGWLTRTLGFPRPIKAELNYDGVGASREAIFSGGLTFHEKVLSYSDKKKMTFSIKAYPYQIPSTTMDEHVVIGGDYFDVLDGTYELQKLNDDTYRLNLYSHYKLTTTFNFYASWWAGWIMKDIQNNILQVIKQRAEQTG
ncbi:MAG: hypothetical protein ABI723_11390 [Bacteroidia bacterium]